MSETEYVPLVGKFSVDIQMNRYTVAIILSIVLGIAFIIIAICSMIFSVDNAQDDQGKSWCILISAVAATICIAVAVMYGKQRALIEKYSKK